MEIKHHSTWAHAIQPKLGHCLLPVDSLCNPFERIKPVDTSAGDTTERVEEVRNGSGSLV